MKRIVKSLRKETIKKVLILAFAVCYISASAQQDSTKNELSGNIESYADKLSIYAYSIQKFNNFELKSKGQKDRLQYGPNENLNLGLGFSYKWIGIGAAFKLGSINSDNDLYGETNSFDLQMDIYSRKFLFNGNFQFYQGFYWRNPDKYFPDWSIEDSAVVRPDIITGSFGFSGTYILNHENFSFKAAYQSTERQLKSAGSWLLGLRFSVYAINADSSLVPIEAHDLYPNTIDFTALGTINWGGAFGYTHTFVFSKYFYFNAALMIGINLQSVEAFNLQGESLGSDGKLSSNALFRMALGCNKPTHFYGFNVSTDSFLVKDPNETEFSYNYGKIRFYYGRRFNVGKK